MMPFGARGARTGVGPRHGPFVPHTFGSESQGRYAFCIDLQNISGVSERGPGTGLIQRIEALQEDNVN